MKLSTSGIRSLMKSWLTSDSKMKDELKGHYIDTFRSVTIEEERVHLDQYAEYFSFKVGCSAEDLLEHIYKLWCDPNEWKREGKERLEQGWEDYLGSDGSWEGFGPTAHHTCLPKFTEDTFGNSDEALVKEYFNDPKRAEKCILRTFIPKSQLGDTYRLEVVTTPEDDKVIGWVIIQD